MRAHAREGERPVLEELGGVELFGSAALSGGTHHRRQNMAMDR